MTKSKVAIVRCESYDEDRVYRAVKRGIDLLGGVKAFLKPGESIVLKPNVVYGFNPDKCITTNPVLFKGVARVFKEGEALIYYGDSPAFGRPISQLRKAMITSVADELGIKLADFEKGREIRFRESPFIKKFIIAKGALDNDGLISISKMKTHRFLHITGAVKNQFGCVPGMLKPEFHVKLSNPYDFARMLVVLNLLLNIRLFVMDGITAMDGSGPRTGKPVQMNVLLFSRDPVALDAVMCRIIDLDPELVPTITAGKEYGLGTYYKSEIEILGDPLKDFTNKDFDVVRKPIEVVTRKGTVPFVKNLISPRPVISSRQCVKCGTCVDICPVKPKALNWRDENREESPLYRYKRCIRCFCCQELCPENAISIKDPLLRRLVFRQTG